MSSFIETDEKIKTDPINKKLEDSPPLAFPLQHVEQDHDAREALQFLDNEEEEQMKMNSSERCTDSNLYLYMSSLRPAGVAPRYYEWRTIYPQLQILLDNINDIRNEIINISADTFVPWPEGHVEGPRDAWTVFPFLHTFPAYDISKTTWIDRTCHMCPLTVGILKSIPNIRTALFSRLAPGVRLAPHTGWADLSNHVLRCHLCLKIPLGDTGEPVCGMEVEDEIKYHVQDDILIFDDSKRHLAFNYSTTSDRLILILDLVRPFHIPLGSAVGGHTPQLDDFISTFK